jgi:hypothetical protein
MWGKPPKAKTTMSSREAAALILSEGATDDVEEAELLSDGKILDRDKLIQAHFRRQLGFDFTVIREDVEHRYIIRDEELDISVTCPIEPDFNNQGARLAKATMKLKKMHEDALKVAENAE